MSFTKSLERLLHFVRKIRTLIMLKVNNPTIPVQLVNTEAGEKPYTSAPVFRTLFFEIWCCITEEKKRPRVSNSDSHSNVCGNGISIKQQPRTGLKLTCIMGVVLRNTGITIFYPELVKDHQSDLQHSQYQLITVQVRL